MYYADIRYANESWSGWSQIPGVLGKLVELAREPGVVIQVLPSVGLILKTGSEIADV